MANTHLPQIITSYLDNDLYKFTMNMVNLHQFPDYTVEWTYKNRNPDVKFTQEMIDEINYQIDLYCNLRYQKNELDYLRTKVRFLKYDFVDMLTLWHAQRDQITCVLDPEKMQPEIHFRGPNWQVSWYEVPVMAIVAEVYFRMHYTTEEQAEAINEAKRRLDDKIKWLNETKHNIGNFSEFGTRRRFSKEFQDYAVGTLSKWQFMHAKFVGTSNVYLAMKYGIMPSGTTAHEETMLIGQGNPKINPAYSNYYFMQAWHKEYGTDNGILLTDTIGTDVCLKDINKAEAILWSGYRHDSGDPFVWGEKILAMLVKFGIDTRTKTLLFSDSLNFKKAADIYERFSGRCNVAFGIGTWLVTDTTIPAMNQVIKLTEVNGIPVCKLSDAPVDPLTGLPEKYMGKDVTYATNLAAQIKWRLEH